MQWLETNRPWLHAMILGQEAENDTEVYVCTYTVEKALHFPLIGKANTLKKILTNFAKKQWKKLKHSLQYF